MSPLKSIISPPTNIKACIVNTIRVLRLILTVFVQYPTFMKWAEAVKMYLENPPGNAIHVKLDDFSPGDENIF